MIENLPPENLPPEILPPEILPPVVIPTDLASLSIYIVTALVTSAYIIRWARRMFYTEKKDTAQDQAETGLYDILSKENKRMADQMRELSEQLSEMSKQINILVSENHMLTLRVTELTTSVKSLSRVEQENIELIKKICLKDEKILQLTQDMADMSSKFNSGGKDSTK